MITFQYTDDNGTEHIEVTHESGCVAFIEIRQNGQIQIHADVSLKASRPHDAVNKIVVTLTTNPKGG